MIRRLLVVAAFPLALPAQPALEARLSAIAVGAKGKVSVACSLPGTKITCNLGAHSRPPMQSVFKFPLALAALHRVEKGGLSLDQPIRFLPTDRILPRTYSPLQERYPEAGVDVPLRELLRLAVSLSDNTAADIVLRILGGPQYVTRYVRSLGIRGFHLQDGEAALHCDNRLQYRNWFQPSAAVALLRLLADRSPLNREHTDLLLGWMIDTPTGAHRLKEHLAGLTVAHKTGTSGTHDGITNATNDIGLISLPDGRRLAIAVFVTDARATSEQIESVIARIAKQIFDDVVSKHRKQPATF